jgi:putative hydrolase of the HAD superfamily
MVATYQELCAKHGVRPSVDKALEVYMIAESVNDIVPALDEAAVEVLAELSNDFEVNILTLGDEVVQSAKLYRTGIYRHVDDTRIVAAKNADLYREIAAENPERIHVMVGNSKKADIGPALEAGWHAVWLETGSTWDWDDHELEADSDRLHVISSLWQVAGVVRAISQKQQDMAV